MQTEQIKMDTNKTEGEGRQMTGEREHCLLGCAVLCIALCAVQAIAWLSTSRISPPLPALWNSSEGGTHQT